MVRKTKHPKSTRVAREKISAPRRELAEPKLRMGARTKNAAVLPPAARAYAKKVESNRQRAIEFLKKAGIIDRPGTLARPYR